MLQQLLNISRCICSRPNIIHSINSFGALRSTTDGLAADRFLHLYLAYDKVKAVSSVERAQPPVGQGPHGRYTSCKVRPHHHRATAAAAALMTGFCCSSTPVRFDLLMICRPQRSPSPAPSRLRLESVPASPLKTGETSSWHVAAAHVQIVTYCSVDSAPGPTVYCPGGGEGQRVFGHRDNVMAGFGSHREGITSYRAPHTLLDCRAMRAQQAASRRSNNCSGAPNMHGIATLPVHSSCCIGSLLHA